MIYYIFDAESKEFLFPQNAEEQPENSTTKEPINADGTGLYEPIKWNGSNWVGASYEEWLKFQPQETFKPDKSDLARVKILQTVAKNDKEVKALKQEVNKQKLANAMLLKKFVMLAKGGN